MSIVEEIPTENRLQRKSCVTKIRLSALYYVSRMYTAESESEVQGRR